MNSFKAEMEKWFHPHIVATIEAEFARLEARIRELEVRAGIAAPPQGGGGVEPPVAQ